MQHIEEHILELYLLGDEEVSKKGQEIEAHLKLCHGCREMAQRIKSFYATAEEEFEKQPTPELRPGKSLVRKRTDVSPFYEADAGSIVQQPVTRLQRFQYFARRHPVTAGAGSFAFLAGLALLTNTFVRNSTRDENPIHLQYNEKEQSIQLFNSKYEKLWSLPTQGSYTQDEWSSFQLAQLFDTDNDGRNELLTVMGLGEESSPHPVLRVFDYKENLLRAKDFSQPFVYLNRSYSTDFSAAEVLAGVHGRNQLPEIFVVAKNDRSPFYIARLDAQTNTIGEYWHFGHFDGLGFADVDGDSTLELLAWGQNNTEDTTQGEYPAIIVLNSAKIVGKGKSRLSPGFDMPFSDSEVFYIRLPLTDVNRALHTHSNVSHLRKHSDGTLWFTLWDSELGGKYSFEFVFSPTMQPLQVKSTTWTDRTQAELVDQGKLKGKIDDAYLQNLKDGVRYWDGRGWKSQIAGVNGEFAIPK